LVGGSYGVAASMCVVTPPRLFWALSLCLLNKLYHLHRLYTGDSCVLVLLDSKGCHNSPVK